MYRQSREELISELKHNGIFDENWDSFFNSSHEEKVKEFEAFCCKYNGNLAILFSDDEICDNKDLVMIAAKHEFSRGFQLLSERLLCDPDIALALADCDHYEYTKISKSLRDDPELMLKAVRINPNIYCSLPVKVKVNRDIVLEIARKEPRNLKLLLKVRKEYRVPLQNDKRLAIIVAKKAPGDLKEFFSEEILKDKEIQEIAFRLSDSKLCEKRLLENTWAIKYVDPEYWLANRTLVKKALSEDGRLLRLLPESYRADKDLVLIAVKEYPEALEYSSEKLLDDKDVIGASLHDDADETLRFASKRLRADYDLVFKAVIIDAFNLQYASDDLRDNRTIVVRAVKSYGCALEFASERLQEDEELKRLAKENM